MRQESPAPFAVQSFWFCLNDSPDSQTIHFPCNDQTSGSHPSFSGFCTSATSLGMPSPNCQQPELGSGMELGSFPSQSFPGLPHPLHLETRTQGLPQCPAGHPACSPLFLTAREKVGRGGGKGGAEGLNKTDQKALHFSPNTQLFND